MIYTKLAFVSSGIVSAFMGVASLVSSVDKALEPALIEATATHIRDVRAGQTVLVSWEISKITSCPGQNSRVWIGADGFFLAEPSVPNAIPVGTNQYNIPTVIPEFAAPGKLTMHIKGYFQCTPGGEKEHFTIPKRAPLVFNVIGDT